MDMYKLQEMKYHLDTASLEDITPYLEGYNQGEFNNPLLAAALNERYHELTGEDHPVFLREQKTVLDSLLKETLDQGISTENSVYQKLMNNLTGEGQGIDIINGKENDFLRKMDNIRYRMDKANIEDIQSILDHFDQKSVLLDGVETHFQPNILEGACLNAKYRELTGHDHPTFARVQEQMLRDEIAKDPIIEGGAPSVYQRLLNNLTGEGPGVSIFNGPNHVNKYRELMYDLRKATLEDVTSYLDHYDQSSILVDGVETHFRPNVLEGACLNARYHELTGQDHPVFARIQEQRLRDIIENEQNITFGDQPSIYERLLTGDVEFGTRDHPMIRSTEIMRALGGASLEDVSTLLDHFNGKSILVDGVEQIPSNDPLMAAELNNRYRFLTGQDHPRYLEQMPKLVDELLSDKDRLHELGALSNKEIEGLEALKDGKPFSGPSYAERVEARFPSKDVPVEEPTPIRVNTTRAELMAMKENISQMKNNPYLEYRAQLAKAYLEKKDPEEMLNSVFSVRDGEKPMCDHVLESVRDDERKILQSQSFEYNDQFKKQLLEPAIVDFAKSNPVMDSAVQPHPGANPQQPTANYQAVSETNNVLSVNNIEPQYAATMNQAVQQIEPTVYQQQQMAIAQQQALSQEMGGQALTLSNGGMGGFAKALILVGIVSTICALIACIALLLIG